MSGWIDPLGTRALIRYIRSEQGRLKLLAVEKERLHPRSRGAARYRARYDELSRFMALVQAMQRPGAELVPYKQLVNAQSDRRDKIEHLVPARSAP